MATDNVDIFKKIIFRIPSSKQLLAVGAFSSIVFGAGFYLFLQMFSANLLDTSMVLPHDIAIYSALFFFVPAVVASELFALMLPDYPRRWGLFLSTCNMLILAVFMFLLTGANTLANAWAIIWLATTTLFLSDLFVLTLTIGYSHIKRIFFLSLIHPVLVLLSIHLTLGPLLKIPTGIYIQNMGIILLTAVLFLVSLGMAEFLLRANVNGISVISLTSGLLQKRQEALDMGYVTRIPVQTLRFSNKSDEADISIPWIHPGPLEGFGGGRFTSKIIENLNRTGKGFFFHVPTTHKSDPTDPDDFIKIIEAMEDPETCANASELVEKSFGDNTFYGRKVDGKKIVYLDMEFDDAEIEIFLERIDLEEVVLVDLHNHERADKAANREEMWYNTEKANEARRQLQEFLELLEDQETYSYRCGFSVATEETPIFSLVEEVNGQKTLLFGIEGNESSPELLRLRDRYRDEFDKVLLFTTDTHQSIHDLSSEQQVEPDRVINSVEEASSSVSDGSLGFASSMSEPMKLLQEDYNKLILSINILVRLIPLSLLILYLGLLVWIF